MSNRSDIQAIYGQRAELIAERLREFARVPRGKRFYELAFCLMTPQSRAANAWAIQQKLEAMNFFENPRDISGLLGSREHYVRFHNQKSRNILAAAERFMEIEALLDSDLINIEKRRELVRLVRGMGFKEASHFLRNIGYRGLAILDRHILKLLLRYGAFEAIPPVATEKNYLAAEAEFFRFAGEVNIDPDELDLLFWSEQTGEILK